GVNVYSGPFHPWYAADQKVRENLGGIWRDHKLVYPASARYITGGGSINPANGTIIEKDPVSYPYERITKHLKNIFDDWTWKGKGNFRIGTADETGLGYQYWGTDAEKDLQKYLRNFYHNEIKNLNDCCQSNYNDFAEIKLPLRQPESTAQHAIWEHWRQLREAKLESIYDNFYKIVKSLNPELDVFHMPSTGASHSPLYGVNYYNVTKFQDVNGIDGTCCTINQEWLYNDLSTKRNLTSEWGGLYSETSPTYVNSKLWEELSGGALGFEHHVWSFGNDSVSFVDGLDMPRIFGNMLRMTLRDARKIDHLILDGERAAPEIGILFSQTTRVHDQAWGWNGEKTFSPHFQTVANYYELFLEYHRSARVIAEEMLLEDKMPAVTVLFVPQAQFLSEETQKKLLDYAKKGGIVISEGRMGAFDAFGRQSDIIFRELGLVPSLAESRELLIGKTMLTIPEADSIFAPVGAGEVLARLGESPGVIRASYGQGNFVVLGFNPGLQRYAAFPAIIEHILRQLDVTPKFIVSDAALLLREWQYDNDSYLILNSRAPNWSLQEVTVKVRGRVEIEDYLFGQMIQTEYQNGYTSFNTLAVNGARIFRIPGRLLAQNQMSPTVLAEARQHPAHFLLAGTSSGTTDDFQPITLPYQGRLSDSSPLKYGDFVFSLTTLASGSNAKLGDMYLTVSKGKESQKKHLKIEQDYYFRLRDKIFKIRSSNNFYMFPFYCELSIEVVDSMPAPVPVDFEKKNDEVVFANSLIAFTIDTASGAAISSIKMIDEMTEQTSADKSCFAASGGMPGPFLKQNFQMNAPKQSADFLTAEFVMGAPSQGQQLQQTIGFKRNCAGFTVALACRNAKQLDQTFDLRWHPELAIGSAADSADIFFVPSDGVVKAIPFRALNSGYGLSPSGNWAAIVDSKQKLVYLTSFIKEQVQRIYIWEAKDFYTLEVFAPKTVVKADEALCLDLGFYFLRGLTGIDAWQDGVAVYAKLPTVINQNKSFSSQIQIATAFNNPESVALSCSLWQNDKIIKQLTDFQADVAFDLPLEFVLNQDLSAMADGQYQLRLIVKYAEQKPFVASKPLEFAGNALNKLLQEYEHSRRKLDDNKNLNAQQTFSLRVQLEELRRAATDGNIDKAQKILFEYKKVSAAAGSSSLKE
ncbi:MAG: beta-galactosidase, partial [Lentisphaeria bacterium]